MFSDILFAPTSEAARNLRKGMVFVVGNTVIDSLKYMLKKLGRIRRGNYVVVAIHRQENVKNCKRLEKLVKIVRGLEMPVKLIAHPHFINGLKRCGLYRDIKADRMVDVIPVMPYGEFIRLVAGSKGILTDSGGLSEECCELGVLCLNFRRRTERPEAVSAGFAKMVIDMRVRDIRRMLSQRPSGVNPYGDGYSGRKIVAILEKLFHGF